MTEFQTGSVPLKVVAKIISKEVTWVRAGIITGYFPVGVAVRKGKQITSLKEMDSKLGRINYYVSPKLLYEKTGYLWKGEKYVDIDKTGNKR